MVSERYFSNNRRFLTKMVNILTLKDIQDNYDIELSFVTYYGIVRSIRKYFSSFKIVQLDTFSLLDDINVMRKLLNQK